MIGLIDEKKLENVKKIWKNKTSNFLKFQFKQQQKKTLQNQMKLNYFEFQKKTRCR